MTMIQSTDINLENELQIYRKRWSLNSDACGTTTNKLRNPISQSLIVKQLSDDMALDKNYRITLASNRNRSRIPRNNDTKKGRRSDWETVVEQLSLTQVRLLHSLESNIKQLNAQQWQMLLMLRQKVHKYKMKLDQSKPMTIYRSNIIHSLISTRNIPKTIVSSQKEESIQIECTSRSETDDDITEDSDDSMITDDESSSIDDSDNGEQPMTDLLSCLRTVTDEKSILSNRLSEFDITMTGCQIIDKVAKVCDKNITDLWNATYLPGNRIPHPPQPPPLVAQGTINNDNKHHHILSRLKSEEVLLLPQTPSVYLSHKTEANSPELEQFCLSQPVVLIRNLAFVLPLDLGIFSTKALVESNPNHKIEQRIQDLQAPDENKDPTGKTLLRCFSSKSITTIQEYGNYQARTFVEARRDDKSSVNRSVSENTSSPMKHSHCSKSNDHSEEIKISNFISIDDKKKKGKIFFGTNCDLSNQSKWSTQLNELNKLPNFLKVVSPYNLLSHCGFTIMGMNSVQLYMKVPGCRTPGHQENNNFCSININIGPGDCEWFSVPERYWGAINSLCEEHKVDYLSGSWWPSVDDLRQRQIPLYRFIQRPGDLVWINSGTVHWVQSIGWCNNVAWNVGPFVSRQYSLAMERYEYNKLRAYKSIVPMVHLSWQLARDRTMNDSHLYQLIKYTLMISMIHCSLVWNFLGREHVSLVYQPRENNELTQYCEDCECEVFNIFLIKPIKSNLTAKKSRSPTYETRCLNCALKMKMNLSSFKALYQYELSELVEIYDSFKYKSVH